MTTKTLVPVGDCGRAVDIQVARSIRTPAAAPQRCVTRRPFYVAPDMFEPQPEPTEAEFPQTRPLTAHDVLQEDPLAGSRAAGWIVLACLSGGVTGLLALLGWMVG